VQENCFIVRSKATPERALIVDPGEEADRLLQAAEALETNIEAILLTHTHFDHVGAVAPIAKATGAPVYCPELETQVLANIMDYVPWPGFGRSTAMRPTRRSRGRGARACRTHPRRDLHARPQPRTRDLLGPRREGDSFRRRPLSGVGRPDRSPGGDWPTLLQSIDTLIERHPPDTTVYPGHMGITTLQAERATNPFPARARAALTPVGR